MKSRKQMILDLLQIVPVLSRDQLIAEFFRDNSNNKRLCAKYCRELHNEKRLYMNKRICPFVCFASSWKGPKTSGKLDHHLDVAAFYLKYRPRQFIWEPNIGLHKEGFPTPDGFAVIETRWLNEIKRVPYFIEIQSNRSNWSNREVQKKLERYEKAYRKKKYDEYSSVPPVIWIVSDKTYKVETHLKVIQRQM